MTYLVGWSLKVGNYLLLKTAAKVKEAYEIIIFLKKYQILFLSKLM